MPPQDTIYRFHVANLREVDKGLEQTGRELRRALAQGDHASASALTKLYALGLAVKVECRLSKLAHEPNVSEADRAVLLGVDPQVDRWHTAIELGLRKHFAGASGELDELTLGHDIYARYRTLRTAVEDDLRPLIELRNKLAHGQWVFPLGESNEIAKAQKEALESENALSLSLKNRLLGNLADVIHDLVVSRRAFESSFERSYRSVLQVRQELNERKFENFKRKLQAKKKRGRKGQRPMGPALPTDP
jgi:hypothetical protein